MASNNRRISWPLTDKDGNNRPRPKTQGVQTTPTLGQEGVCNAFLQTQGVQTTPTLGLQTQSTEEELNLRLSEEETDDKEITPRVPRNRLTQEERQVLRKTFDHLQKKTLLVTDIQKGFDKSEFSSLYQQIQQRFGLDDKNTTKLIQSSYRAMNRKK